MKQVHAPLLPQHLTHDGDAAEHATATPAVPEEEETDEGQLLLLPLGGAKTPPMSQREEGPAGGQGQGVKLKYTAEQCSETIIPITLVQSLSRTCKRSQIPSEMNKTCKKF